MAEGTVQENIRLILEFYKELGFERLPLSCNDELQVASNKLKNDDSVSSSPVICHSPQDKESALAALCRELGDCRRCALAQGRSRVVPGEGNPDARIMFIGEAPGREEDIQGRPFVGDAGRLLTKLIEKMGFERREVYIANIIKCRPPMNRDPQNDEISSCIPFLERQIGIVSPRVIVSLGKISAHTLLGAGEPPAKFSITRTRGRFFEYRGIPVMPTFHPAYLLRNPKDKWLTWDDAQAVLRKLDEF